MALTLRVGVVFALRSEQLEAQTYEHGEIARNLLEGRGFSVWFLGEQRRTSQQAPVYPGLLAVFYTVFGVDESAALLGMQLFQCILGTGLVLAVVWITWQTTGHHAAGWFAGLGMAVYPTHLYAATHIQVAVLASLLTLLVLALSWEARRRASIGWAALAGLAAGVLVLTDPILALAAVVGAAILGSKSGEHAPPRCGAARRATFVLGYAMAALLVVSPWIIRNRRVHGEWVFVKSTFGYAFWQGNNALSLGTDKIPKASAQDFLDHRGPGLRNWNRAMWEARHETLYMDDVLLKPSGYRELIGMTEPQKSRFLMAKAIADLRHDPARYPKLCLRRLRFFLLFDDTNPKARNAVYRIGHAGLLFVSLLGIVCSWPLRRRLWPTYAVFLLVTGFHVLTITSVRFHLPLEPLQIVWAGIAAGSAGHWAAAKARRLRRRRDTTEALELPTGQSSPALPVLLEH